jgi:hypothetical protein
VPVSPGAFRGYPMQPPAGTAMCNYILPIGKIIFLMAIPHATFTQKCLVHLEPPLKLFYPDVECSARKTRLSLSCCG